MNMKKWTGIILSAVILTGCGSVQTGYTAETEQQTYQETIYESETAYSTESAAQEWFPDNQTEQATPEATAFSLYDIPEYSGSPVCEINGNVPYFTDEEKVTGTSSFEQYSELDELGRCQVAYASIGQDIMPTEDRGEIGSVKPTGWHTVKYAGVVDGNYLYNRCHLIAYCLAGENANEKNLVTGTRYMNIIGMLPYETEVAQYMDTHPDNHVLYRITPEFLGNELVCRGVLMEAYSVEDNGAGISFCVYAYNVQPGVEINYSTGESWLADGEPAQDMDATGDSITTDSCRTYVANKNSMKFHTADCPNADKIADRNRLESDSRDELVTAGYAPAGCCKP